MFLSGLQLRVISLPILKLFAFLWLCSGWAEPTSCFPKTSRQVRHTADALSWKASPNFLSWKMRNTVNLIAPVSSSLVCVSHTLNYSDHHSFTPTIPQPSVTAVNQILIHWGSKKSYEWGKYEGKTVYLCVSVVCLLALFFRTTFHNIHYSMTFVR